VPRERPEAAEDEMTTFVIGFAIVVLGAAGLATGLLLRGRPLRAGCRGANPCSGCASSCDGKEI